MDPLRQQQISMKTVEVYNAIEEELLQNIAKRLRQHRTLLEKIETDQETITIVSWQTAQLALLDNLTRGNIRTIAKHSGLAFEEVAASLEAAGYEAVEEYEGTLAEAAALGILLQPPEIGGSEALEEILSAFQEQAVDKFNMTNTTMLEQAGEVYKDIINQTVGLVMAGTTTPLQALRRVSAEWARFGIPALIKSNGHRMSTEAYVNMVMRSTVNNVANQMQDTRMDEYSVDLVEISSHLGARPKCAPYQGKIFSRSGRHQSYPALSETSYGDPAGLFGVNCRHVKFPYVPGLSKKAFQPYNAKENREAYEESQIQRKLERDIRAAKKEARMMEGIGDEEGIAIAKQRLRDRQAKMRAFIEATGRTRNRAREQIV